MSNFNPDQTRRNLLKMMGLVPATMIIGPGIGESWALTNQVTFRTDGRYRYISSNGIPDHETGRFPNKGNPNRISAQKHEYKVPLNPELAPKPTLLGLGAFGFAINGVPFEPFAAEFYNRDRDSGWQYEALTGFVNLGLDENNAHVQPTGSYHYHGVPTGLIKSWSPEIHSPILGYAADGFPIYGIYGNSGEDGKGPVKELTSSWRLKSGTRPSGPRGDYDGRFVQDFEYVEGAGDLDRSNAKFTVTEDYPGGTYAYFLTAEYPFIPRYFAGTPDPSFLRKPKRGGPNGHKRGHKPGHKRPRRKTDRD